MDKKPFYLILFQEVDQAEAALAEIRQLYLQDENQSSIFNEQLLYGKGEDEPLAAELIALCQTPPFTGKKHFVVIRRAEKLSREDRETLFAYLERPSPYAILVFMFQVDSKTKLPFPRHQLPFFYTGEEQALADNFGITNALRQGNTKKALRILDHQFRSAEKDFPRLFGILTWYLRQRITIKSGGLTEEQVKALEYFYALEKGTREGRLDRRTALEMAIVKLAVGLR